MSKIAGHLKLGSTGSGREAITDLLLLLKPTNLPSYLLVFLVFLNVCLVNKKHTKIELQYMTLR